MKNLSLYILTVLIWGSTWYVITFQLGTVDPFLSVGYRFLLASVFLFAFCAATGRLKVKFTRRQHGFVLLQGILLFCLNYWATYSSTAHLTSGLVALCFSTLIILNIINQALFFKMPIKPMVVLGAAMGLGGIALVFQPEIKTLSFEDETLIGIAYCLFGTVLVSFGNMTAMRNNRDDMPVILTNTYGMLYGGLIAFAIALLSGSPLVFDTSFNYIWSLVYLAVLGSAVAFGCYLTLMRSIGADKAAYATVMFPVVALGVSTVFEGYVWTPQSIAGMVLILAGNVVAMRRDKPSLKQNPA